MAFKVNDKLAETSVFYLDAVELRLNRNYRNVG